MITATKGQEFMKVTAKNNIIETTLYYTENENKQYIVKRTSCGHYYVNQIIHNKLFYKKFVRLTKKYLQTFLPL